MKKFFLICIVFSFVACESSFDYDLQGGLDYGIDEEGDPVIDNIKDNDEIKENFQFGSEGGFCYGSGTPNATVSTLILDDDVTTEYDISQFLPEVGSQGKQGSCVAWATGYYLKSFQENYEDVENGVNTKNNKMSPAYIYNQIKVTDCFGGSVIKDGLDILKNQGIVDLNVMNYNENDCDRQPTDPEKVLAEPYRIENYFYLDPEKVFEQTKASLLNNQPVVIAIKIDRSYFGARDENGEYIYEKFKSEDGSHAMMVVGYDDNRNAFKVVNSWGKEWGNQGFVWIDYSAFQEAGDLSSDFPVLCEAWVAKDRVLPQSTVL